MSETGAKDMVPAIRFEGFDGDWTAEKLLAVAPLQRGFDLPKDKMQKGIYPVVMSNGIGDFHSDYMVKGPGVVTGRSGTIGKVHFISSDFWPHNTSLWVTTFFENEPLYIYYLYSKMDFEYFGTGSGVPTLNRNDIHDIETKIPTEKEEQTKIGAYFQELDTLIAGHRGKRKKLLQLKKSLLEKMFPMEGEDKPEIRFAGFDGDWAGISFGDSFKNIPNNTLSRADMNYQRGLAQNVHYGDVLIKFGALLDAKNTDIPFVTSDEISIKLSGTKLHNGDVIIADAAEDSTVGKCAEIFNISDETIFAGLHTIAVRPAVNFASKYLGYYMNSKAYHHQLTLLMQGTKVLSISKTAIQKTNVSCPHDLREQTKLGELFEHTDTLINQHQSQIINLLNIKQACLAKMFV